MIIRYEWTYFIMKSSQAWGFFRRALTTGPYSCGSIPYSASISATSAASVHFTDQIWVKDNLRVPSPNYKANNNTRTCIRNGDDLVLFSFEFTHVVVRLTFSCQVSAKNHTQLSQPISVQSCSDMSSNNTIYSLVYMQVDPVSYFTITVYI